MHKSNYSHAMTHWLFRTKEIIKKQFRTLKNFQQNLLNHEDYKLFQEKEINFSRNWYAEKSNGRRKD